MPNLPSGTVTFVFSDIEGSTRLLQQLGDDEYARVLALHRQLVRQVFAEHGGQEIDTQGDAFFYSFERARAAVATAVAVQRAHAAEPWPEGVAVRTRLGLHTREPAVGDEGYTGLDVVRAARIAAGGRGGRVLLSEATRAITAGSLPDGVEVRSLGERQLKDIDRPEPVYELVIDGLPEADERGERDAPGPATTAAPNAPNAPATTTGPADERAERRQSLVEAALSGDLVPAWARDAARRRVPPGVPGSDGRRLIEERVLAQIESSLREKEDARRQRREAHGGARRGGRGSSTTPAELTTDSAGPAREPVDAPSSVADEVARLRALRDAGA